MAAAKSRVVVYSTAACPWCHRVKDWLSEHGVKYEEVDVGADSAKAQEMIDKSGQMGVPVIEVNGQIIVGFDEAKLRFALGIKG
ncbi:MAG: NrdH-redoxin [Candidatus Aenigmarchaeota archaeon]|nr:NrdH-redoxin [Candidatus Aenigmarchaeota archaeon]